MVRVLNQEFDIDVLGSWNNAEECIESLRKESFDVAVMDMKLIGMNGIEATRKMLEIDPSIKVIILSAFSGDEEVFGAISAGAMGYLPKDVTVEALVDAVRSLYRGHAVLDPSVTHKVLERFSNMKKKISGSPELSNIETQILTLASKGYSNKEIALEMDVKEGAVKSNFREILRKLDARDRTHAVTIALKSGWIE